MLRYGLNKHSHPWKPSAYSKEVQALSAFPGSFLWAHTERPKLQVFFQRNWPQALSSVGAEVWQSPSWWLVSKANLVRPKCYRKNPNQNLVFYKGSACHLRIRFSKKLHCTREPKRKRPHFFPKFAHTNQACQGEAILAPSCLVPQSPSLLPSLLSAEGTGESTALLPWRWPRGLNCA